MSSSSAVRWKVSPPPGVPHLATITGSGGNFHSSPSANATGLGPTASGSGSAFGLPSSLLGTSHSPSQAPLPPGSHAAAATTPTHSWPTSSATDTYHQSPTQGYRHSFTLRDPHAPPPPGYDPLDVSDFLANAPFFSQDHSDAAGNFHDSAAQPTAAMMQSAAGGLSDPDGASGRATPPSHGLGAATDALADDAADSGSGRSNSDDDTRGADSDGILSETLSVTHANEADLPVPSTAAATARSVSGVTSAGTAAGGPGSGGTMGGISTFGTTNFAGGGGSVTPGMLGAVGNVLLLHLNGWCDELNRYTSDALGHIGTRLDAMDATVCLLKDARFAVAPRSRSGRTRSSDTRGGTSAPPTASPAPLRDAPKGPPRSASPRSLAAGVPGGVGGPGWTGAGGQMRSTASPGSRGAQPGLGRAPGDGDGGAVVRSVRFAEDPMVATRRTSSRTVVRRSRQSGSGASSKGS